MKIVITLFPGITHLDFTGPHQFFTRIPDAEVMTASLGGEDIYADGLCFSQLNALEDISDCDLLCVPGGFGVVEMIHNTKFMEQVKHLGQSAKYITSICTGSIILAAADLLEGKKAACHWAWRGMLAQFPNVEVLAERVVRDGNTFTGGGVTAGIDMAITVIAEILGDDNAKAIQLGLEYAPEPPFNCGRPDCADSELTEKVKARMEDALGERKNLVKAFLDNVS